MSFHCSDYVNFLSVLLECGELDLNYFFELCEDWDLEYSSIVEKVESKGEKVKFPAVMKELFVQHANRIKDELLELLEDMELEVNKEVLSQYEPKIYLNYRASSYDEKYEFWNAKDAQEALTNFTDDVVEFLVNENIVTIDCEDEDDDDECDKRILKSKIKQHFE